MTWPCWLALGLVALQLFWQAATVDIDDAADCLAKFRSNAGAAGCCSSASQPRMSSRQAAFIRANTAIAAPLLVPEIRLHLAGEITPLWQATEATLARDQLPPPYWAFAWAGGQALARHVLDHPELVRGKPVLDVGAGSGLLALAAVRAALARPRPPRSTLSRHGHRPQRRA